MVRTKSQLETVKKYPIEAIYTDNLELLTNDKNLYYQVPKNYNKKSLPENLLISDIGLLHLFEGKKNMITDYSMNVANESMISLLLSYGVKKVTLSLELPIEELEFFSSLNKNIEVLIYGRVVDMKLKAHPLIKENGYALEDVKKNIYPIFIDSSDTILIYHHEPINKLEEIPKYLKVGITSFRLDFSLETPLEIQSILEKLCQDFTFSE